MDNLWIMAIGLANLIDGVVRLGTLGFVQHSGLTSTVAMHYTHYKAVRMPMPRNTKSQAEMLIENAQAAAEGTEL